ncbi:MAG: hypothetical protein FWG75_02445 [Cystobacterineae bacterium]|nr:hypothetical protein [Cystobacterineae bacterium]
MGFKGAKLAGEGNIEVKCNEDGTYSLRTGGKLGAGVEASLAKIKIPGVKAGAEVSAGALLSAGSQVEFTFNSPQDAVRAAGYFSIQAAGITPVGMALTAPSQIKSAFDGDIVFLAKHLSAIELSGEVSGQLQAKLGLKSIFEVGAGAETKASLSARLELEQGKPSALVFSEEMSAGLEGALGLNLEGNLRSKAAEGALSINGGSASGSIKLTAERRFSIDSSQYKSLADLNKLNTSETERTLTTTVEGTFNGIASSSGKTSRLELSLHGTPSELSGKELINSLFQGNFAEAAKRVGDNIQCTMTRSEVSSSGGSFNPSAKVLGTGMSAELNYEKTSPREISREKASLTQLAQSFAEWAKSALNPPVRMGGGASGQW